jgi:hypothetical protein
VENINPRSQMTFLDHASIVRGGGVGVGGVKKVRGGAKG